MGICAVGFALFASIYIYIFFFLFFCLALSTWMFAIPQVRLYDTMLREPASFASIVSVVSRR